MTIGDLADAYGIAPETLAEYERCGLLHAGMFGPRQRLRLELILKGRRLGFSLDEIKTILDGDVYTSRSGR